MAVTGEKIVVVGGSSGIGLAAANDLAKLGAKVVIASRSEEKLRQAKAQNQLLEVHVVDIRDESSVETLFQSVGSFDHLVVSAANAVFGDFLKTDLKPLQDFLDTKFWGAYRVIRAATGRLQKDSSITLVSGAASRRGTPGLAVGSAINAGLEALGRTLAVELAPIRVNTIAPGLIDTPVWDDLVSSEEKATIFKDAAAKLPLKRIGRPEDIAIAVRFLIENTYMTGQVIYNEGGYLQV